ncbi:ankyrin repeat, PH and SEC7 domain containing protein secG-like [Uloborus diversus]|uniref:ankyrin repeat, PH and SEC7 domain containing protein secG-like n=1 Tax=Uloborus diversus TaxID=327109 RepID=UPI00240A308C|nr:ankyrin repeat, PH and SEC7 domain containing protein secG-like [Uloborus diversus]
MSFDSLELQRLIYAVERDNQNDVRLILQRDPNLVNAVPSNGSPALHLAATLGYTEMVMLLLAEGADTRLRTAKHGFLPVHLALFFEHEDTADILVDRDSENNLGSWSSGHTPLHLAAEKGYLGIMKKLLTAGADIRVQCENGDTPLHSALTGRKEETAEFLCELDSKNEITNEFGETPLHLAAGSGMVRITRLLLAAGADFRARCRLGYTPLHCALLRRMRNTAEVLADLDTGNDLPDNDEEVIYSLNSRKRELKIRKYQMYSSIHPHRKDEYEKYSLLIAFMKRDMVTVEKRSKSSKRSAFKWLTALHLAATLGYTEMVMLLLAEGADTRLRTANHGFLPVHLALFFEHEDTADILVDRDSENNLGSWSSGHTPLHLAAEKGYLGIMKKLLAAGADIRVKCENSDTPLHSALTGRKEEAAEFLCELDSKNELTNEFGETPLHLAAGSGMVRITRLLLAAGADFRARCKSGYTPLHCALLRRMRNTAEVLADLDTGNDLPDNDEEVIHSLNSRKRELKIRKYQMYSSMHPHKKDEYEKYSLLIAFIKRDMVTVESIISSFALRDCEINLKDSKLCTQRMQYCKELYADFKAVIQRMKNTKLDGTTLSYFDLARAPVCKVALYLRNKNVGKALHPEKYRCFNLYRWLISSKIEDAQARRFLNDECLKYFDTIFSNLPSLPRISIDMILGKA